MSRQNLPSVALRTLYSFSFSLRERQKKAHEKRSVQRDFKKEEISGLVPGFRFFINDVTVYFALYMTVTVNSASVAMAT